MYLREPHEITEKNQEKAQNQTFLITKQLGPTFFEVLKPASNHKYRVKIGHVHTCTCNFKNSVKLASYNKIETGKILCVHICWILLKYLRINVFDDRSWQIGFTEREITQLLDEREQKISATTKLNQSRSFESRPPETRPQTATSITIEDVCPICQESLLSSHKNTAHCHTCKQNLHLHCMKIWMDHQSNADTDNLSCPMCRQKFMSLIEFRKLMHANAHDRIHRHGLAQGRNISTGATGDSRNTGPNSQPNRRIIHTGTECSNCQTSPIQGRIYFCQQTDCSVILCAACFTSGVHDNHQDQFTFKVFKNSAAKPARKRFKAGGLAAMNSSDLQRLEAELFNSNDRDQLLSLDQPDQVPAYQIPADFASRPLPEHVVNKIPSFRLNKKSKFLDKYVNKQCLLCLKKYAENSVIRKLFCGHIFHRNCIDGFLLEDYNSCPICGGDCIKPKEKKVKKVAQSGSAAGDSLLEKGDWNSDPSFVRRQKMLQAALNRQQVDLTLDVRQLSDTSLKKPTLPKIYKKPAKIHSLTSLSKTSLLDRRKKTCETLEIIGGGNFTAKHQLTPLQPARRQSSTSSFPGVGRTLNSNSKRGHPRLRRQETRPVDELSFQISGMRL